jgi:hypothetical protein
MDTLVAYSDTDEPPWWVAHVDATGALDVIPACFDVAGLSSRNSQGTKAASRGHAFLTPKTCASDRTQPSPAPARPRVSDTQDV